MPLDPGVTPKTFFLSEMFDGSPDFPPAAVGDSWGRSPGHSSGPSFRSVSPIADRTA